MAKVSYAGAASAQEREFLKLFEGFTRSRSGWQAWEDLMTAMACSIANSVDRRKEAFERRERQYETAIKNLGGVDVPAQMLALIASALEENPNQDFLGKLYMSLNLGSHWTAQFFTPFSVSEMMARMTIGEECLTQIKKDGYISVNDPTVGAGGMLIAAATAFRALKVNYQTSVLFTGQDIDPVVAKMAYIQISLLGCPGYITVGNTLTNPQTGHALLPEEKDGLDIWYTPMFMRDVWDMRRSALLIRRMLSGIGATKKKAEEKERYFVFFDFREQEDEGDGREDLTA